VGKGEGVGGYLYFGVLTGGGEKSGASFSEFSFKGADA